MDDDINTIDLQHILLNKEDAEIFFVENEKPFFTNDKKIDMIQASHRDGDVCIIDARKLYEWLKEHYENN